MLTRLAATVAALTISASSFGQAQAISLGDAMPAIGSEADWLQGSPVTEWEQGHVYVLDFWATWCGPCIASIPHVNELSKQYADKNVTVIGMAIWPRNGMVPTRDYVAEKGDEMSYTIAEDRGGALADRYMTATGSRGIPTVMIVNGQGQLVWKGHPMSGFDDALEAVVNGDFDLADARRVAEIEKQAEGFLRTAQKQASDGDWSGAISNLQAVANLNYHQAGQYALISFKVMANPAQANMPAEAIAYGKEFIKNERFMKDADLYTDMARFIAEGPVSPEARDLDLALAAANLAVKHAKKDDFAAHAALASVHHARGEYDAAVKAQAAAITIATDANEPKAVKLLESELEEYKSHATN